MDGKETAGSLANDLARLIDDKETADAVVIISDGRDRVYVHRLLLWSRCQRYRSVKDFWGDGYSPKNPYVLHQNSCNSLVFRSVVRFIYTGEISLRIESIFDVLQVANDMEISDLLQRCRSFITEQLTPETAAQLLKQVFREKESIEATNIGHAVIQSCLHFVEDKAEEVVATRAFLDLPKQVIIQLVSSNKFALEEADVWRCSLAWAKHQVNVNWDVKRWNQEDRDKLSAQLDGIVNHIKLMLIDSKVYAEEVEPTGLVPMKMSLERYRFAAVYSQENEKSDPRLQPRILHKLFRGSELLVNENIRWQTLLNEWCGTVGKQWQLLHRASRDGFSAKTFHKNCDEHRPTFTIILGPDGHLCGGYTDLPWKNVDKQGGYAASSRSFLFTLVNTSDVPAMKFNIVQPQYAIGYDPGFGPMFGGGSDLCLSNNCNINSDSYSNFPHTYNSTSVHSLSSNLLMGSDTFTVKEYEVFTLKGPQLVLT